MSETFKPLYGLTEPQPMLPAAPTVEERGEEVYQLALEIYQTNPDWVSFFRKILAVEGIVRRAFPNPLELAEFERSGRNLEIQQMLVKLREKPKQNAADVEPTRVITVRLPKSLHESLRNEAHERKTSMNQLCISKLLQIINNGFSPDE